MSNPGFEPGLPRPQRGVLTARRIRRMRAEAQTRVDERWLKDATPWEKLVLMGFEPTIFPLGGERLIR